MLSIQPYSVSQKPVHFGLNTNSVNYDLAEYESGLFDKLAPLLRDFVPYTWANEPETQNGRLNTAYYRYEAPAKNGTSANRHELYILA